MTLTIFSAIVSLAAGLLAPPGPVEPLDRSRVATESHCVVTTVGQESDGELITTGVECFDTFADAMVFASNGSLLLPRDASGSVLFTDPGVSAMASTFTLGVHFDGYSGTGSSTTVVGADCTGGYWNTPAWFDNKISSSYNGCARLKHFDYANASGYLTATTGAGTTDNLPYSANNKTESVSYHSS
ncbi:MAG: hypothetical protein DWP92_07535 [Armatimonadetes bacterium]|nr:MAG: hypothetical protein DWP92_07535 [Armatimonadota bacterium]